MNNAQCKVSEFTKKYKISLEIHSRILDLSSEVGECCKLAFNETLSSDRPKDFQKAAWEEELGDCLFSLLTCFEALNLNADSALDLVIEKYNKRFERKGSISSGN